MEGAELGEGSEAVYKHLADQFQVIVRLMVLKLLSLQKVRSVKSASSYFTSTVNY